MSSACRKDEVGQSATQGLHVEKVFLWDNATTSLCFDEDNSEVSFSEYMPHIQTIAEEEYNKKTAFKFTGFNTCSKDKSAHVKIEFKKYGRSGATIATNVLPDPKNEYLKLLFHFILNRSALQFMELYTDYDDSWLKEKGGSKTHNVHLHNMIIHELGHVVGLDHEHRRKENANYFLCEKEKVPDGIVKDSEHEIAVGKFDVYSVMNYCQPSYLDHDLSLSQGDIATINSAYQKNAKEKTTSPADPLNNAKIENGCVVIPKSLPNFDGCAEVLKLRAKMRGVAIPSVSGANLRALSSGCVSKYSQTMTCNGRVLDYIFGGWPGDNFSCVASGGGWGCIEPAPVAAAPAPVPSYEQAVQNRINASSSDAKNYQSEFTTTGSVRCFRDSLTSCLQGKGGGGCVIRDCVGSGDLLCSNAQMLYSCAVANGGTACFDGSHGACGVSNGGGSR